MYIECVALSLTLALTPTVLARSYTLENSFIGRGFLEGFGWENFDDPTHGRVDYVDQQTALVTNLSFAADDKFVMRADHVNVVGPNERGRRSVRIISNAAYDELVLVLDLQHMPEGCSTWPAFWTKSATGPWPQGGEIDILEGVNLNNYNLASLHTTPGCTMPQVRCQTGSTVSTNCDVSVNFNQGCGTSFDRPGSYGNNFNNAGGGYYVMEKSASSGIKVWFWSRDDPGVPLAIRNGWDRIMPSEIWGWPEAGFPLDSCDYVSHFDAHQIVFDLTFCGDWAGNVFASSGCGNSICADYVDNTPTAFEEAYWEINSLRVYTPGDGWTQPT